MPEPPPSATPKHEPRKPFHRRPVRRQVILLVLCAPLVSLLWYYTPSLKDLSIASWHRRCANYKAQGNQVVYDDDPATYPQRLNGTNYVGNILRQDRPYALRDNPEWQGFNRARYDGRVAPVAFLGARTSPGGNRRLVAVQFGTVYPDPQWNRIIFTSYVETTGVTGLRTTSAGGTTPTQFELFRHAADNLRVLDGQSDANDSSRFTIDVQVNGTTHTIEGQLQDNDTVTLTPRASRHVKFMNMIYWNPTGVKMFDWLSKAPGATMVPATAGDPNKAQPP